ncbi:MAG TPA: hypothetical protein VGH33_10085 [Isosphaeraceae bacterium]
MSGLVVKAAVLFAWTRILGAIGRRAGPGRVGLLLGLPSTTAAALVACARESGSGAAVVMADAGLLGLAAAVALPAAYAHAAGRGHRMGRALAAALACYAAVAAGLGGLPEVGTGGRMAIAAAAILAANRWAGRRGSVAAEARSATRSKRSALPGALAPAACLMLVTALRESVGAAWAGLLTPFPAATLALLVATHAEAGSAAACRVAAAVPRGSFGTLAFLATFRSLAPSLGPGWGAAWGGAAAIAALLAVGAITGGASASRSGGPRWGWGSGSARRIRGTARSATAAGGRTNPAAPGLSCVVSWSRPRPASPRCRAIRRPTRSPPSPSTWPYT